MNRLSLCLGVVVALAASAPGHAQQAKAGATSGDAASAAASAAAAAAFDSVLAGSWRDPKNVARDAYRHPKETLSFFGVTPEKTVIEITPGGGWYSEILAPYLSAKGQYIAAVVDPASAEEGRARDYHQRSKTGLEEKFAAAPAQYGKARVIGFDPKAPVFGPAGSADVVLTFRNVHNWRMGGQAEGMFEGFYQALKPGGVLGVVEHRAAADVPADDKSGYVGEAQVIALAEAAGFRLDAKSEINANPKDTKDHPNGVWTLPPANRHDAADAEKYKAIGES
ncbi:MAG TPA: methyltransferase, partial [Pseudoxanthomonas sp.]|nr:methyltransferase [Pseudoxanthomonas sp.]